MSIDPNTVRAAADAVQWADVIAAVAILILSLEAGRRWPQARPFLFGPVTYAAHGVVFHVATLMNLVPAPWTSLWSATLRMHSYAAFGGFLAAPFLIAVSPSWLDFEASDE